MIAEAILEIADVLGTALGPVFAEVADWRERLAGALSSGAASGPVVDEAVEWLVAPSLDDARPMIGAGFVAAPGYLEDAPWHLAWWVSAANGVGLGARPGTLRRLDSVDNPLDESFHDYTRLEWWRGAVESGGAYLTGPYIDYLCTDELTLTLTAPVMVDGRLAGVVGADLSVARLERLTDGVLHGAAVPAVVGTAAGRVIAATDAAVEPGTPARRLGAGWQWHPVPGCGGTLAVAGSA
ncbi:cache domain-containing protein [Demequina gelatinilytica]|uniref:cache domain-containing protein n=1 Tax=Demequina gelatinilytica TaxID=1638980 RepID=UPI00078445FF|nr:cache domain-containing protein [Demequina gelatinilytica]